MSTDQIEIPDALTTTRRIRHVMSAEVGHDPKRLLEYFQRVQREQAQSKFSKNSERLGPEP